MNVSKLVGSISDLVARFLGQEITFERFVNDYQRTIRECYNFLKGSGHYETHMEHVEQTGLRANTSCYVIAHELSEDGVLEVTRTLAKLALLPSYCPLPSSMVTELSGMLNSGSSTERDVLSKLEALVNRAARRYDAKRGVVEPISDSSIYFPVSQDMVRA